MSYSSGESGRETQVHVGTGRAAWQQMALTREPRAVGVLHVPRHALGSQGPQHAFRGV